MCTIGIHSIKFHLDTDLTTAAAATRQLPALSMLLPGKTDFVFFFFHFLITGKFI